MRILPSFITSIRTKNKKQVSNQTYLKCVELARTKLSMFMCFIDDEHVRAKPKDDACLLFLGIRSFVEN